MKFNVFPNYKIPIEFILYDSFGERHVRNIGWVSTPDIELLKKDHYSNLELIGKGINYNTYSGLW